MNSEAPFEASYVLWIDGCLDGWKPYGFDTIEECYAHVINYCASTFVITRPPVRVAFTEVHQA